MRRSTVLDLPSLEAAVLSIRDLKTTPTEHAFTAHTQFVFPLAGVHFLDDGQSDLLVDLNQAAIIPSGSVTRDRHPTTGDMACLIVTPDDLLTEELWGETDTIRAEGCHGRPMTAPIKLLARYIAQGVPAAANEEIVLRLVAELRSAPGPSSLLRAPSRFRLIRAVKDLLTSTSQPISLTRAAAEIGVSPAYLTSLFHEVEGVPLYRYHLRLRLAKALRDLPGAEDITTLALDLGFSSHSHFTSAFRAYFGLTPSEYRARARRTVAGWTAEPRPYELRGAA